PAALAGIKVGDIITKIDTANATTQDKIREIINNRRPGDKVKLELLRADKSMTFEVELATETVIAEQPTLARWDDRVQRVWRGSTYRLAVIPIAFPDVKPNEKITTKEWENALFSTDRYRERSVTGQTVYGSLTDYYRELSCGKFNVTGKVFNAVTVNKKRADYTSTSSRNSLLTDAGEALTSRDG